MFGFLQSKKGFTLVELMITLVLMSFGFIAAANLLKTTNDSFNKTESRYVKQETVKNVAEYLQRQAQIGSSTIVGVYNDMSIIPTEGSEGDAYNYLYTNPDDGFLYLRRANSTNALQISDVSLYIYFEPVLETDDGKAGSNEFVQMTYKNSEDVEETINKPSKAVVCHICAIDDGIAYADVDLDEDVYYSLDVAYHFANMFTMAGNYEIIVNFERAPGDAVFERDSAPKYVAGTATNTFVPTVEKGIVLRFLTELTLSEEGTIASIKPNVSCFIATAAFGTAEDEVGMLCDFRDNVLFKTEFGTKIVNKYYEISPPIADFIRTRPVAQAAVRIALKPIVAVSYAALNPEILVLVLPVGALAVVTLYRRAKDRKVKNK
ncbi:MAG: prepilin-type N-terminal cleavage/methylation domain-containing protein [Clostridiales bacterium]|nr:prepilin-type N-terminal cleavage/methylation domain-containing protein [Clostridiales bacterium]